MKRHFLLLAIISFVYLLGYFVIDRWERDIFFSGDSNGYYLHVVSAFVNQDVGDYDQSIKAMLSVRPDVTDPREIEFGIRPTEKGKM